MLQRQRNYSQFNIHQNFQSANKKVNQLLGLILVVFISAILVQNNKFDLSEDALSSLGNIYPGEPNTNLAGFMIIVSGMLLASIISFRISKDLKNVTKYSILKLTGVGFILLAVPSNQVNILHSLGGVVVIGSLWWFMSKSLFNLYEETRNFRILLYLFILQATVLPYAILYFTGAPVRQAAQKLAVLGIILILKLTILGYLQLTETKTKTFHQ